MSLSRERDVALSAVLDAVRIARDVQNEITPGGWDKADRSPVTVADLAVQGAISRVLLREFPDDPLMAEEGAAELREAGRADLLAQICSRMQLVAGPAATSTEVLEWIGRGESNLSPERRYWMLDPIDGTKGFLRKQQYAIALALVERGQILLGVLACPNLPLAMSQEEAPRSPERGFGQVYVAVRGQGAFCVQLTADDRAGEMVPVHVATVANPAQLGWCERVETSSRNQDLTGEIVRAAAIEQPPIRLDSQAKYAVVARGEAALYLRHTLDRSYREMVWDHAAGVILTEEAGGRVTDLYGQPLDFTRGRRLENNRGIVATNGLIHDRVLAAVKEILAIREAPAAG